MLTLQFVLFMNMLNAGIDSAKLELSYNLNVAKQHCTNNSMYIAEYYSNKVECIEVIEELYYFRVPEISRLRLPLGGFEVYPGDIVRTRYKLPIGVLLTIDGKSVIK